ncbi:hypothetical protein BsWGS_00005 [Bradybaena similaris]
MSQNKRVASHEGGSGLPEKVKPTVPQKRHSNFVEGSIVRIKLTKFLTYDSIEFKTGPYLNVIIGPNGTGKSAIVCAICLGLAGKTNTLGRASELKDFIKYGADRACIEIELFNPHDARNYIIRREITSSNTSHWWFNGQPSTLRGIEELVSRLKIQVGNLCQFLPQEKVADFARMSQQELLENTEKSVGRADLYESHQLLKTARQTARHLEQDVAKLHRDLDQEKQKNARLEHDVKSYKDRKTFLEKVAILKMKKPWLSQKIQAKARDMKEQSNMMLAANDKIDEAKSDYESKVKEEESRDKRLMDLREQLKALENSLAQLDKSDVDVVAKHLEKVNNDLRHVSNQMTSIQSQGDSLSREINNIKAEIRDCEAQVKKIEDVSSRRMETLRSLHAHTCEAVLWLRANKDIFKHTIHEPMIISLNVMNPADAKLVEAHVNFNDLRSFICEDADDLDLFMRKVKNEMKLRVNIVKAPPEAASSFLPRHPISYYKKYGFDRYLQSLFTCPEAVMRFLCLQYKVHLIPVGSRVVQTNLQRIMAECPELTHFYTPDVQYTIKQSKYSRNMSSRNSALKEPRALVDSINLEKEQELSISIKAAVQQQKLKEDEYRLLQKKSEGLSLEMNRLREAKKQLLKQKDETKSLRNQITTKEQRIQQIMGEHIDLATEKVKLNQQLMKVVDEKMKYLHKMKSISLECVGLAQQRVDCSLQLVICVRDHTVIESQLRQASQRCDAIKREAEELKEHVHDLKQQAREKLVEAKRLAGISLNEQLEQQLTARGTWEEFTNAPNRLDELDNEIHSLQARAEVLFQVDEQVIREFEDREKEIRKLEELVLDLESKRQTHQQDISQAKRKWLQPLTDMIQEINTNFSYFFSCLNCCGEVSLSEPENPEDYEKYGMCIKVKFRDDETLQELTAHRQSGGERSVATVLYMMALQELTRCPFRCVDEINQGMDPRNERKIFQLVVQTVCKKSISQYFLLTPKLLPDLEYDNNMTVLCVYNGLHLVDHSSWVLDKFIQRRKCLSDT